MMGTVDRLLFGTCSPKLRHEFEHVLGQFVKFTMGKKYQIPNAGMVKRFIKTHKMFNKDKFEAAFRQLQIKTKKCYVATYCFGDEHPITNKYRSIRPWLLRFKLGEQFVAAYYEYSPKFVNWCDRHPKTGQALAKMVFRPLLKAVSRLF